MSIVSILPVFFYVRDFCQLKRLFFYSRPKFLEFASIMSSPKALKNFYIFFIFNRIFYILYSFFTLRDNEAFFGCVLRILFRSLRINFFVRSVPFPIRSWSFFCLVDFMQEELWNFFIVLYKQVLCTLVVCFAVIHNFYKKRSKITFQSFAYTLKKSNRLTFKKWQIT